MKFNYITVDSILAKLHSLIDPGDIEEADVIEWIGEALSALEVAEVLEDSVALMRVENHQVDLPLGFKYVMQLARYDGADSPAECEVSTPSEIMEDEVTKCNTEKKCDGAEIADVVDYVFGHLDLSYRPYFDMQWQFTSWMNAPTYKEKFTPIRLSNHTFFNTLVCKEEGLYGQNCNGQDEYTIIGTMHRAFRFSFEEGYVALSYKKAAVDPETGYPLVPDTYSHINAVLYYVKWKIAERMSWSGREGFRMIAQDSERLWLKYVKQANNKARIYMTIDDFQDQLEESTQLIPNYRKYYNYFGNLGRPDFRKYSNPRNFRDGRTG